tara:strand:+ start:1671 stop:2489 length:819 start_codon:yes stop_codon:yes gene_type:complete
MTLGMFNWLWSSEPEWNLDWVTKCEIHTGVTILQDSHLWKIINPSDHVEGKEILTQKAYLNSTKGDESGEGNVWLEWIAWDRLTDKGWQNIFGEDWRSLATPLRSGVLSFPTVCWNLELLEYDGQAGYTIAQGTDWVREWSYSRFLGNSTQSGLIVVELDDKQVVPFAVLKETFETKAVSLSDSFNLAVMRKVKEIAPKQLCEFFQEIFYYQEKRLMSEHGNENWFSISGGTPIERLMIKVYSRQELREICYFDYDDEDWATLNSPSPKPII